jgi:hypothetical protein
MGGFYRRMRHPGQRETRGIAAFGGAFFAVSFRRRKAEKSAPQFQESFHHGDTEARRRQKGHWYASAV